MSSLCTAHERYETELSLSPPGNHVLNFKFDKMLEQVERLIEDEQKSKADNQENLLDGKVLKDELTRMSEIVMKSRTKAVAWRLSRMNPRIFDVLDPQLAPSDFEE